MHGAEYPEPHPWACPACVCTQEHTCRAGAHTQVPAQLHRAPVHSGTCQQHTHTEMCTRSRCTPAHVCHTDTRTCAVCTNAHVPTSTRPAHMQSLCTPTCTLTHVHTNTHAYRAVHTSVCSVTHINTRVPHTEPRSHLQSLHTPTRTELCTDPLTPESVQFNTCVHISTSTCTVPGAPAHTYTVQSGTCTLTSGLTRKHVHTTMHRHTRVHSSVHLSTCVHTEPCALAHTCTESHTLAHVQSHTHWHIRAQHSPRALLAPTPPRVTTHGAGAAAAHAGPSRRPGAGAGGTAPSRPASAPRRRSPALPAACQTAATTAAGCPPR